MADMHWTTMIKDFTTASAIAVGGLWALYRFVLSRGHATNLYLNCSYDKHYFSDSVSTVFVTVRLENCGKRKLSAKPPMGLLSDRTPAYKDQKEILHFACGLQFRELSANQTCGHISWYGLRQPVGISELNVLDEFECSTDGTVDFQLEPGEVVEITVPVNLPKAHYIAKLHFIGGGDRMEYWSKLFWLRADGPSS